MYFPESDSILREHPDLQVVLGQIDEQLFAICSRAPLRPGDFSCLLGAEENQVESVFELLGVRGVVTAEQMVECDRCQNLMPVVAFQQAIEDEDDFECTGCGRVFRLNSEQVVIYRLTDSALKHTRGQSKRTTAKSNESPDASNDEPLSDRAQEVLVAMLNVGAFDSDSRRTTEEIAAAAIGPGADANALKGVMSELSTRLLIETKVGRSGGCWLTPRGRLRAEKLRSRR